MRRLNGKFDKWRLRGAAVEMWGWPGDETCGAFIVPMQRTGRLWSPKTELRVIASGNEGGEGWDHVSVSLPDRCPTWEEMEFIKRLFFRDDEVAMQLHVPPKDHISVHDYCLHLWRPQNEKIPLPPSIMVG